MNKTPPTMPQPSGPVPMPSREASSHFQFDTLFGVLASLQPYLLLTHRELDSAVPKELDGGVVASASTTFMRACDRLDGLLADEARWTLAGADSLYSAMVGNYEAHKVAADEMTRPSRIYRPSLTTVGELFVALWGDSSLPGGLILGRGTTPADALLDFDAAFTRAVSEQVRFAPESVERLKPEPMPEIPVLKKRKTKPKKKY